MSNIWTQYAVEVAKLKGKGMTISDAQRIVDVQFMSQYGIGWERRA